MAVTAADFVFPTGYLRPAQFGFTTDTELETHIDDAWLDVLIAAIPTATDDMKNAYVCWKANEALTGSENAAGLVKKQVGDAQEQYNDKQDYLKLYLDRAEGCKDDYERLADELANGTNPDEFVVVW